MGTVFEELVKIKMEKSPQEKGWNCMYYIKYALEHLAREDEKHEKHIPSVPAFTKL